MYECDAALGEHYTYRFSAEFDSQVAAYRAAESLKVAGIPLEQIRVVRPTDPGMAHEVEPQVQGVAWVLVKKHVMLGLLGLMVGLAIAAMLVTIGLAVVRSSPMMTFIALGFTYPLVAVLLAGAVTLRPDHGLLIEKTRTTADSDCWGVVAHCSTRGQRQLAKITLDRCLQAL
ncbi:hypothetical protein [Marinobacter maritimus]|uniref:hypothetical protein n=1 Tax=Marinobacter maritimus TaxID=277961 RepID=UPI0011A05551|nr:hypothetical protein [Marinobacter maritimus]